MLFDFEKLDVYRLALEFFQDISEILRTLPKQEYVLNDQLKRAALSIPLNIAEGMGRKHLKDRKQFMNISRGSVFECVPLLTILGQKGILPKEKEQELRKKLLRLTQMLVKLSQSLDSRARNTCS